MGASKPRSIGPTLFDLTAYELSSHELMPQHNPVPLRGWLPLDYVTERQLLLKFFLLPMLYFNV